MLWLWYLCYGYGTYDLVNARLPTPSTIIPKTIAKIN